MKEDLKQRFIRIYANLPLGVRQEVILVLDKYGPITWNPAFIEVNNDTAVSKKILKELARLEII